MQQVDKNEKSITEEFNQGNMLKKREVKNREDV